MKCVEWDARTELHGKENKTRRAVKMSVAEKEAQKAEEETTCDAQIGEETDV